LDVDVLRVFGGAEALRKVDLNGKGEVQLDAVETDLRLEANFLLVFLQNCNHSVRLRLSYNINYFHI